VRVRTPILLAATAVVASIALYATHATPTSTRYVVREPYTTTEVLEYLLFFTGRAATDHPALAKPDIRGRTTPPATEIRTAAVELMSRCIHSIDEIAGPALTAAFNAADPQRLDDALQRLDAVSRRWITAPHKRDDPCPPPRQRVRRPVSGSPYRNAKCSSFELSAGEIAPAVAGRTEWALSHDVPHDAKGTT
jgi:hypothetical protein